MPEQRALEEHFADNLEACLGLDQTKVSYHDEWDSSRLKRSAN